MRSIICVVLVLLVIGCKNNEFVPNPEGLCQVSEYVYKQESGADVRYDIDYTENSLTQVSLITNQKLTGGNWVGDMVYKHNYKNDSLFVVDFRQFKEGDTWLKAQIGEKISVIITTFPENSGTFRYTFDHSKTDEITVTLDRLTGSTATFDQRGVYKFTNEDIDTLVITRNPDFHGDEPDDYTTRTKTYTYDVVRNPLKGLILSHFIKPELPDVTFFSARNRTIEKYNDVVRNYKFEYGTDPMPTKLTKPEGVVEKYNYTNCTN